MCLSSRSAVITGEKVFISKEDIERHNSEGQGGAWAVIAGKVYDV